MGRGNAVRQKSGYKNGSQRLRDWAPVANLEISPELRLRPAAPEDRFLIRRWLNEPEIQAWWGNAGPGPHLGTTAIEGE